MRVHLARHAGVVHDDDRLGARRDRRFDLPLVEVERVGADVDEHRPRAAQHERVRRRDERERRHDDFVAGLEIEQQRRHLERRRARLRQQHTRRADAALEPGLALLREASVAGQLARGDGFLDVRELLAGQVGSIEWNHRLTADRPRPPRTG